MNFFTELKRRNVFRVAIAYLIAAWLLLQLTSTFVPILGLPFWVTRLVFLMLLIGLLPTVIAAWALELTPEGIRLEKDVERSGSETVATGRKLNYFIIGALVLIISFLVAERVYIATVDETPVVTSIVAEPGKSVAVLPFADLSQDQNQEWFGDGLTEEILNALARTPDLMVTSRTSAFLYKSTEKSISTIAEELGVKHVLEGSVRGSRDRIRVTAQLIRAADDFHLWSQTYDRDVEDVIGIQEDIALRIAKALETTLDPKALEDMMRVGTRSVRAYEAYIRGLALKGRSRRTASLSDYRESYEQFELARDIDPKFAAAHREAAEYWKVQLNPTRGSGGLPGLTPEDMLGNFLERIDLAIDSTRDPTERTGSNAEKSVIQLRLRTAVELFRQYLESRPNDYRAWHELLIVAQVAADRDAAAVALGKLKTAGEFDRFAASIYMSTAYRFGEASAAADYGLEALERWPNDAGLSYQTHRSLLWAGRVAEGANLIAHMKNANSASPLVRARQGCAEGRRDDVLQILERLRSGDGGSYTVEWMILMLLGDHQQAVEILRIHESGGVPYQLASWLVFHYFDPSPFPSLTHMLERENIQRPLVAEIPFACPPSG